MPNGSFTNADVDALETILQLRTRDMDNLWISFVVGAANLTDFNVDFRTHPDGGFFTVATAAGDFTTPVFPVVKASSDLNLAAAGATVHYLNLNVKGVETVRLQAAGTSSTITGHWGSKGGE